ncbi:MAG: hypothetical protein J5940_07305 [Clostridia bacterium]|nr:hypothetical protein [Clostridia bacterium]
MNNSDQNVNGGKRRKSARFLVVPLALAVLTAGLTALAAFLLSLGRIPLAMLVSAICAGAFSALMSSTRSAWCVAVLPASFAAAFFTGGIWCAGYAVAFAAVASVVYICIQKKTKAAAAVNYSAAATGIFLALISTVAFALAHGGLSLDVFKTEFNAFFDGMAEDLTKLVAESGYGDLLDRAAANYSMTSQELINSIVTTVKYVSPSLAVASVWLYSFVSVQFFKLTVYILSLTLILPDPKWRYRPNVISARIYLADYFVYLAVSLLSGGAGVILIAAENLLYILLLPMMVTGISSVAYSLRNPVLRGRSLFTVLLLAASLVFLPTVFFFLVAMMGAFYVIFDYRRNKAKQNSDGSGGV